jgi:hypothetical protein
MEKIILAYSPPKKITIIISFLFLAIGLFILVDIFFNLVGILVYLPPITFGGTLIDTEQFYAIIGMVFIFISWLLLILGVRIRGM